MGVTDHNRAFLENQPKDGLGQRSVKGGAFVMSSDLFSTILRVGSTAVLARLLLPEDFGLVAMVTALTVYAERFQDLGFSDATVQAAKLDQLQVSNLFWANLSACVIIGLLLASLSMPIARFYHEPRLTSISLIISSTFLFNGLVIQHQALLRRQLRFGALAFIQIISVVASLIIAVAMAYLGFGYWALVAREFSRAVFYTFGILIVCPWRPGLPRRRVDLGNMFSFAKHVTGFNLIQFAYRSLDKVLLGRLYGPDCVGIYTNAYSTIMLPVSQIRNPVYAVALPVLSALQTEPSEFRRHYLRMVQLLTFVYMPIIVLSGLFADEVVRFFLGSNWGLAVPIVQILSIAGLAEPLVATVGLALVASGKTRSYFRFGLMNGGVLLVCVGAGSAWGATGVALGISVATLLTLLVGILYGLRQTPVDAPLFLTGMTHSTICSLGMGVVMAAIKYAVGWFVSFSLMGVLFSGAILVYFCLWLLIPEGKILLVRHLRDFLSVVDRNKSTKD